MSNSGGWTCSTPDSQIWPPPTPGVLTTDVVSQCLVRSLLPYRRAPATPALKNQFYRVGDSSKWGVGYQFVCSDHVPCSRRNRDPQLSNGPRENASVQTGVTAITSGKDYGQCDGERALGYEPWPRIRCWASPQEIGSKSSTTGRNFGVTPVVLCQIDQVERVSPHHHADFRPSTQIPRRLIPISQSFPHRQQ